MYTNEVALRYAMALSSLAAQNGWLDVFEKELNEIEEVLNNHQELEAYLTHPEIKPVDKQDLVRKIFTHFSLEMQNFLVLLIEKKRWQQLKEIRQLYIREANLYRGRVAVSLETAYPIEDKQVEELAEKLEKMTNRPVDLSTKTVPELIGGVKVRIGHQVIDGSVLSQLRELRRELLEQKGKSRGDSQ